ncbi:MAG: chemotaxis protein CheW [Novosphingobium sp. 28-62-57]|uniref:chemotaxis protein CheW n=1 Tax=unclassified Novosphingobium TaxID=2644732 RepID=UPI000BC610F7|nr:MULTISPECIES: chemotaxis protein CheW [unclassified Novosphingobium]OYW47662.1 MAG: chemotaxis protein CheW [Novosphingobium sp. 12-63-9]OYZ08406.1 MAG: chemotaxis protein CheW [Novosphingobium sp. 28-62-57]OZA35122.1 MAG: chemotaxis protein CheW [Novosphingobium sp. 17-62-9]HQS69295.1 chemotaxis protein CheW [Novosphingobium sp.]
MKVELIAFEAGGQLFGLDIMAVREIRAWTPVTPLPQVPHYVAGVVNLRGAVLPVIDLAARLGWPPTQTTPRHAIIVIQLGTQTMGLIVDSVSDIVALPADALQPPPSTGQDDVVQFLQGLAALSDRMVMVLDLSRLEATETMANAA